MPIIKSNPCKGLQEAAEDYDRRNKKEEQFQTICSGLRGEQPRAVANPMKRTTFSHIRAIEADAELFKENLKYATPEFKNRFLDNHHQTPWDKTKEEELRESFLTDLSPYQGYIY